MSTQQKNPVDQAFAELKKYAGASNDVRQRFFIVNYLLPTLDVMRSEYFAAVESDIDDDDEEFTGVALSMVQALSALVDLAFRSAGWMDDAGLTGSVPDEVKKVYDAVRTDLATFTEITNELYESVEDDGEGEDEAPEAPETPAEVKAVPQ